MRQKERYMREKKSVRGMIKQYVVITIATLIYAIGISLLLDPNQLAPGGVSGIAIIVSRFVPLETGTLILCINIPLILIGIWKLGWGLMIPTFYGILLSSVFTNMLAPLGALTNDKILAALGGSLLLGTGIGSIFKVGATTGGTDIIVRLLKLKFPHMKTGLLFFAVDVCIVVSSGIVFRNVEVAMYAGIAVVTNAIVMDLILYGKDGAKLVYIISDKPTEIAIAFMEILDLGVTYLEGRGAYSNKEKQILMCVMRKGEYPKAEEIVKEIDADSFLIVTKATEIFGEGYKNIFAEKV